MECVHLMGIHLTIMQVDGMIFKARTLPRINTIWSENIIMMKERRTCMLESFLPSEKLKSKNAIPLMKWYALPPEKYDFLPALVPNRRPTSTDLFRIHRRLDLLTVVDHSSEASGTTLGTTVKIFISLFPTSSCHPSEARSLRRLVASIVNML
jgi:hypothetical protein